MKEKSYLNFELAFIYISKAALIPYTSRKDDRVCEKAPLDLNVRELFICEIFYQKLRIRFAHAKKSSKLPALSLSKITFLKIQFAYLHVYLSQSLHIALQ